MRYIPSPKPVASMSQVISKNLSFKEVHLHTRRAFLFYMSYFLLVRAEQQKDSLSPLGQTPLPPSADTFSKC